MTINLNRIFSSQAFSEVRTENHYHNLHGILSISFKNLLLISSNMSFLLISVLLPEPPEVSATVVATAEAGAMVMVLVPVGSAATMASGFFLNKLNFIVKD